MEVNLDRIADLAIEEVVNPQFEATKQFLNVNCIVKKDGIPEIEDIIISQDNGSAEVYFPIEDESYYFVIYVNLVPEISLRFIGTSPGNNIDLIVSSENESLECLLNIAGITPKNKWIKGEKIGRTENIHENSGFTYSLDENNTGELEDKIIRLLDFLSSRKENFKKLAKVSHMEISAFYCGYTDQMWGINFNKETIKKLSEFDLSVDIDLYAGGPNLKMIIR